MDAIRCGEVIYRPATKQELQIPPPQYWNSFKNIAVHAWIFTPNILTKYPAMILVPPECLLATIQPMPPKSAQIQRNSQAFPLIAT
jgi:hypothetical protein